jgi:hypothetical protein
MSVNFDGTLFLLLHNTLSLKIVSCLSVCLFVSVSDINKVNTI